MKRAWYMTGVIAIVFVVGLLALPQRLPAGSDVQTVTLWWLIFNQPDFCRGGGLRICTGLDLTNPEAEPALLWAAEQQVRHEVPVSMKASLTIAHQHGGANGSALTNPLGAEVHLALLTHRVSLPVQQRERLLAIFGGACAQTVCARMQHAMHRTAAVNTQGYSTSNVWRMADGMQVSSAYSTLWRTARGLHGILHTRLHTE